MKNTKKNKALYNQLVDILQEKIDTCMTPYDRLPSERELTEQFDVSRTTVRLALQELEHRGAIYRSHGKGTFVSGIKKNVTDLGGTFSFTEQMKNLGRNPQTIILSFKKMKADKFICQHLNIPLGESVYKLSRLRIADCKPLMVEDTYLPAKFFVTLTERLLKEKPLYDIFYEDFNQIVRLADEELYASVASNQEAKDLLISKKAPVLRLVRKTYNMKNEIIEFTLSVARANQFHYQIRHTRNS